jgi:hypothetical protein
MIKSSRFFGLLQTVAWKLVGRLCFHDPEREVSGKAQKIIGAFRGATARLGADDEDTAVSETLLLADLVVAPASGVEFRQDVFSTGVGFRDHVLFNVKLESNFGDSTRFGLDRARRGDFREILGQHFGNPDGKQKKPEVT